MKSINKVLIRVLVKEFYQENAGFFLIVVGLLFGFLKIPQHIDIASGLASKPVYYLIPFALWSLYALKTYFFVHRIKKLPVNSFLTDFILISTAKRKIAAVYFQLLLLAPILGYSILLGITAYRIEAYESVLLIASGNILILIVAAHFLHSRLIEPVDAKSINNFIYWTQKLPKHLSTLFIHHLFNRQSIPLLFTKSLSIGIIIGASIIYHSTDNDLRYLTLGVLLASGINSTMSFKYFEFDAKDLRIFSNLPISVSAKFLVIISSYALLMLPEMIILFGNNYDTASFLHLVQTMLMFLSLSIFYHAIVQWKQMDMEHFVRYPFLITATLFFVILGYLAPHIIGTVLIVISYLIFRKSALTARG